MVRCTRWGTLRIVQPTEKPQEAAAPPGVRCCVYPIRQRTGRNAPALLDGAWGLLTKELRSGEAGPSQASHWPNVWNLSDPFYGAYGTDALDGFHLFHRLHGTANCPISKEGGPVVAVKKPSIIYPSKQPSLEGIDAALAEITNRLAAPEIKSFSVRRIANRAPPSIKEFHDTIAPKDLLSSLARPPRKEL